MPKLQYYVKARKSPIDKSVKYYAQVRKYTTLSTREVLDLAAQNSNIDRGLIESVMYALQEAIVTFFTNGHNLQFWPLGSFFSTLKSKGAETAQAFQASDIESLRVRFVPGPLLKMSASLNNMKFELVEPEEEEENAG